MLKIEPGPYLTIIKMVMINIAIEQNNGLYDVDLELKGFWDNFLLELRDQPIQEQQIIHLWFDYVIANEGRIASIRKFVDDWAKLFNTYLKGNNETL